MKYKLEIKGHLLDCSYCNSDPQWFPKITDKMFCRKCEEFYPKKDFYDPIEIALDNFKEQYEEELKYQKFKLQMKYLENITLQKVGTQ